MPQYNADDFVHSWLRTNHSLQSLDGGLEGYRDDLKKRLCVYCIKYFIILKN